MVDCIEREATIKRIKEVYCVGCNSYNGVRCRACGTGDAIDIIEDAPAADVAPVVHGRWIHDGRRIERGIDWCHCSECGKSDNFCARTNYCPVCGAKMDGGDSDAADLR